MKMSIKKDEEQEICPHSEGNHHMGSTKCRWRIKRMKENKIRAEMSLSHAEAAERMRRNDESSGSAKGSSAENKQFLAECLQKES